MPAIRANLGGPFQAGRGGPGGWWIFVEPEIHFSENILVPDWASWKKDRMPKIPETTYFEISPDWVCEVVSPSSAKHDRITKAAIYAENKIPFYWLVDPNAKTLECLELDGESWKITQAFKDDDKVSARPFDAITFDLADLWVE